MLKQKLAPNKCQSRLEAGGMPGSQINKRRILNKRLVPAMGVEVQRILNIMKGCGQSSTRSKQVLARCSYL